MSFVSVVCFRKEIPLLRDVISVISSQQIKSSILLLLLLRQDHLLYLVSSTISSLLSPCRCSRLPYHDLSSLLDIDLYKQGLLWINFYMQTCAFISRIGTGSQKTGGADVEGMEMQRISYLE